ncbi:MAG: ABC transporter permease [Methylacidiphilales bacterium]|nr:ABC transporter permease [Candidatus Methylacidiphilales bacterium]
MNGVTIYGIVLRYLYIYRRSVPRLIEMLFWPTMDLLVWGFLTVYMTQLSGSPKITFLIGAMIFWDILYRSAQGVSISFLEDIWARNTLNVFVAPVRISEFIVATYVVGFLKTSFIVLILSGLAVAIYDFHLTRLGLALIPLFANLMVMGWAIGMITMALIMRYGQGVEALAWGIPFLIQPFAAVFYPLEVLPPWMQAVGSWMPATHAFEGMRQVIADPGSFPMELFLRAAGLNVLWLVGAGVLTWVLYQSARREGHLAKFGTL